MHHLKASVGIAKSNTSTFRIKSAEGKSGPMGSNAFWEVVVGEVFGILVVRVEERHQAF